MKKKVLIASLLCVCAAMTGCNSSEQNKINSSDANVSVNTNDNSESSKESKLSKKEIIEMHNKTIERLDSFYSKYNLPCRTTNTYNMEVEKSEHIFNSALAKQTGVDMKEIERAEYNLTPKFTIDSFIQLKWQPNMSLYETIIPEYCKAVINEEVDFKNIDNIINSYLSNSDNNSVSETFTFGDYDIRIYMGEVDYLLVTIKSTYEVK